MLGAQVFPLKKNKLKDIIQQYILQQNKAVYIKNTYFHKSPVFKKEKLFIYKFLQEVESITPV